KNPLGRVTLLAVLASVIAQPLLDDLGEPVQLRPLDRRLPPIPRRYRKTQHLLHALARNPKVTRRLARTHPVPYGETNLQIQFHGENAPALPDARKGKRGPFRPRPARGLPRRYRGRLFHRRSQSFRSASMPGLQGRPLSEPR